MTNKEMVKKLKAQFPQIKNPQKSLTVQARADGVLDLAIYGDIEPDGYDWWTEEVIPSETSARHFKEVLEANPDARIINLAINSMGGYVSEGNAIYTMLKRHSATVNVMIDAFACSMASGIAMAGDHVTMAPNALLMIHNPASAVYGNAVELRKAADDLDVMADAFRQMYLLKSGGKLPEEKLIEMLDAETYLTAVQAKEFGLCDEIEFVPETDTKDEEIKALKEEIANLTARLANVPEEKPEPEPVLKKGWFF